MWEARARNARRDITALARAGLDVADLHTAASELVGRVVGWDLTCWAAIDPETLVFSSMVGQSAIPAQYEHILAETEYSGTAAHSFAELARRPTAVARLSDLPHRDYVRHRRLNEVWRPLGAEHELRMACLVDGSCWAAAGLIRGGSDFTDREVEFMRAISPAIAAATRATVRHEARGDAGTADDGQPAIIVASEDGQLQSMTPAARQWQGRLDQIAPGRFHVLLRAVIAGTSASHSGTFQARIRTAQGGMVLLSGSRLIGDATNQLVVSIEPAAGPHLMRLLLAAYGLTPRERDIVREVMAGHPTTAIAAKLFISPHTVQDHLKSIFAKVGVRSRGELIAHLYPGNQ